MKINMMKLLAPAMLLSALIFSSVTMAQTTNCQNPNYPSGYSHQPVVYQGAPFYQQKRTISERFQNQRLRVVEGIRDGSLTAREADMLRRRQAGLEQEFAASVRAGYMSGAQYAHFQAELDDMSRIIYNKKHNVINQYNDNSYGYRPYPSYNNRVVDHRYYR